MDPPLLASLRLSSWPEPASLPLISVPSVFVINLIDWIVVWRWSSPLGQNIESSTDVEEEFRNWVQIVVAASIRSKDGKVKEYDDDQEGDDVDGAVEQVGGIRAAERDRSWLPVLRWGRQHFQDFFCSDCCQCKEEERNGTSHLALVASMLVDVHWNGKNI